PPARRCRRGRPERAPPCADGATRPSRALRAEPRRVWCVLRPFRRRSVAERHFGSVHCMDFESLLAGWEGEHAVVRHDTESGAWMFVCVHCTVLGPAGGGTRLRVYHAPAVGLASAVRLWWEVTW